MKKKRGDRPYTGLLAKPMILPETGVGDLLGYAHRIDALFEHYGIERWDWTNLCLALAWHHVPGFRFQGAPGAPEKWLAIRNGVLITMVERERAGKPGRAGSVSAACRALAKARVFGDVAAD